MATADLTLLKIFTFLFSFFINQLPLETVVYKPNLDCLLDLLYQVKPIYKTFHEKYYI